MAQPNFLTHTNFLPFGTGRGTTVTRPVNETFVPIKTEKK